MLQQTNGLFDCRYLGPFDRPAQDVVHLVMTLLPGAISTPNKQQTK